MERDFWSCERSKPPKILPKRCQRAGSDECALVVIFLFFFFCFVLFCFFFFCFFYYFFSAEM
jgi:hypothetical protein